MVAFIKQEAVEKAREIEIKADEEFAIEKSKLVRQETAAIDAQYERKFKQAELSQQIARSTVTNKTRLKVLASRQQLLDDIFEKARDRLSELSQDGSKYSEMLKNLVLEGLYALSEDKIQIRARKKDEEALKTAFEQASKEYKEKTGKDVVITLDDKNPLPDDS
jgi:V-type H+-transporting ATPase subunit E